MEELFNKKFTLINEGVRARVIDFVKRIPVEKVIEVVFSNANKRTFEQNQKLWPMLKDISTQVCWHGDWLSSEDWKNILTASLSEEIRIVPNIQGTGIVMLGLSTKRMSKKKFSLLIEFIYAFGAEKGVKWSEKSVVILDEYRMAA